MNFNGLFSLFIFCIETVLLVNLFIFSEKNETNKWIKITVFILSLFQLTEFIICYNLISNPLPLYILVMVAGSIPPLGIIIIQSLWKVKFRFKFLYFIVPLFFAFYYPTVLGEFKLTRCSPFLAAVEFPLGIYFGLYYYSYVLFSMASIVFYVFKRNEPERRKSGWILLSGYILTFLPGMIILLIDPGLIQAVESLFCKFAVLLAFALTYAGLKNKTKITDPARGDS